MTSKKNICQNRKASFNYFIEQRFEAGIVLQGSEVKSIRNRKVSIDESHAGSSGGEIYLYNCHIAEYDKAGLFNHFPTRPRKLLLHKGEIRKIIGKIKIKGYSLVPLSLFFNKKNFIKIELGLGKGKKEYDKRNTIKEREWQKTQGSLMKNMKY